MKLNFWRTTDKAEVDFVVESGETVIPIEVKYKQLKKARVPGSLRSFISKYNPGHGYVFNLSLNETVRIGETRILFLPFYKVLHESFHI
jgi:uncharacterized protein